MKVYLTIYNDEPVTTLLGTRKTLQDALKLIPANLKPTLLENCQDLTAIAVGSYCTYWIKA